MRAILRKISRDEELSPAEYEELDQYLKQLRQTSPESYYIFYQKYAVALYTKHHILIPKYSWDMDQLINYLIKNPDILNKYPISIPITEFPHEAKPYLKDTFGDCVVINKSWHKILNPKIIRQLPSARNSNIVIKYEEDNPYKEKGLKSHFERLSTYTFISRLQTYRYLTRNKAKSDHFEVIAPDCLAGIFTNKEKSIYYYVFLTEADFNKAQNAKILLNYTIHGRRNGE